MSWLEHRSRERIVEIRLVNWLFKSSLSSRIGHRLKKWTIISWNTDYCSNWVWARGINCLKVLLWSNSCELPLHTLLSQIESFSRRVPCSHTAKFGSPFQSLGQRLNQLKQHSNSSLEWLFTAREISQLRVSWRCQIYKWRLLSVHACRLYYKHNFSKLNTDSRAEFLVGYCFNTSVMAWQALSEYSVYKLDAEKVHVEGNKFGDRFLDNGLCKQVFRCLKG